MSAKTHPKQSESAYPDYVRDENIRLSSNSLEVLKRRYLRKGLDGRPVETPAQMFYRVASHVAKVESYFGGEVGKATHEFYDLITGLRFFPNSPTFTGAGTPLGQLAACFTAKMRVTTDQGVKPIAELAPGDRVLTHKGRYRPVTEVHQRIYEGELLNLKVKLIGVTLEVTPEHPILTPKGWVEAGALQVGDWVAIGAPVGERVHPRFDLAESTYADELEIQVTEGAIRARRPSTYQNSGRQSQWVHRFIELTPDLARLCGYYVAEGTIGPDERYVRFTFNQEETDYQKDVIELIERIFDAPVNISHSSRGQWTSINLYSRTIASWFRTHFSHGSANKRIPVWMQYAAPEIQEQFLIGLMRGDGMFFERTYYVKGRKSPKTFRSLRITLSNPALIQQIWQMCLRLGYDAAMRPVDATYVTPNAHATAQISMPPLQSRELVHKAFGIELPEPDHRYIRPLVRRENGVVFFPIERIESTRFEGVVYNCEVDEDHTYVTEGVVVHNCFVLPIEDDMGKHPDGIFQTMRNAALIQQTGGGNGFSFSRLRPRGDKVMTSAGIATGPVGFLEAYDKAFGVIAQGGTRRGANMAVLRVDHPDIEEFITCKADEGKITNFNISVGVTDAFMEAVREDRDFELINPRTGKVWRTVNARELFNKIATYAHRNGEPGVLFIDAANRTNPVPHLYDLEATNPCGEQWLGPYENCCLGSINLARHVNEKGQIDWDKLEQTISLATRFLDDVVEANAYVPAVPQLKEAAHRVRRIGLGIMGLADVMYMLGVRYGSEESLDLAGQLMEFVRYHAMRTSIELARERGPFPAIRGSIYDPQNLKWQPPSPLKPYSHDFGRPPLNWDAIVAGIKAHGIRNGAQTTIAPTGTIGTVTGCEGYGCEPVFALAYTRYVKEAEGDVALTYVSPLFMKALERAGIEGEQRERIIDEILHSGTCQHIGELPADILHTFVVSMDVTPEEHVHMQAALQRFVDNSISKCVVGDTLVLTAHGLTPIQELSDMRLDDQFAPLGITIISPQGREQAELFYYGGFRETRKVRLSYGFEIEGTPNHQVHVLDEKGEVHFKSLDALQIGDTVILYAGQHAYGPPAASLPEFSGAYRTNSKRVAFPKYMNEDIAFLLGAITAEGAISQNGVTISNTNIVLLEQLNAIFVEQFGLEGRIIPDLRNDVHSLVVHSRPLRHWLLIDLGMNAGAENKRIPTCILRASHAEIGAFLRGLFLDAFMTQDGKLFGITLASRELIHQLQVLLLNMDVLATARQTGERAWNLTVQGQELEKLAEQISFVEVWKNERIQRRHIGRLKRRRNYSRLLPQTVTHALRDMHMQSTQSLRKLFTMSDGHVQTKPYQRARVNLLQGHRLGRGDARRIHQYLRRNSENEYADRFFAQDREDKIYLEVQEISAGFAEVFDVTVPGSHSFIANGLGNHNTCNFPPEATVEDVKTAYELAWDLGCKGLTVYVTGSRKEVVLETKAVAEAKNQQNDAASVLPPPDEPVAPPTPTRKHRPTRLRGSTYRQPTPLGTAYITVNSTENGEPFEVFLNVGKAGSDVASVSEALGRLISYVLRMPSPLDPSERLQQIVYQLAGIGGGRSLGFGAGRVRSLPDAIAQVLSEYLNEIETEALTGSPPPPAEQMELPLNQIGDLCPECGQASVMYVEGCKKCINCGYSEC